MYVCLLQTMLQNTKRLMFLFFSAKNNVQVLWAITLKFNIQRVLKKSRFVQLNVELTGKKLEPAETLIVLLK